MATKRPSAVAPISSKRIAWCITGAGHFLKESVNQLLYLSRHRPITLILSSSGEEVLNTYHLAGKLEGMSVLRERLPGARYLGSSLMWTGHFDTVIIAPASANTVAKIRHGIADSLVSNIASQAQKNRLQVIVLPTDLVPVQQTPVPSGKMVTVYATSQDIENAKELSNRKFIKLVKSPTELARVVESL